MKKPTLSIAVKWAFLALSFTLYITAGCLPVVGWDHDGDGHIGHATGWMALCLGWAAGPLAFVPYSSNFLLFAGLFFLAVNCPATGLVCSGLGSGVALIGLPIYSLHENVVLHEGTYWWLASHLTLFFGCAAVWSIKMIRRRGGPTDSEISFETNGQS